MDTKKLRQKILDLAIRGKLVPQDPNDEPASVLLERIRAEKQQLIKEGKIKAPKGSKACDTSHYEKIDGPFEIPESWEWVRLDELCSIKGGKRVPKGMELLDTPTKHIYIRVTNMKHNTIEDNGLKYIDDSVFAEIQKYTINSSDLYLTIAGTIGDVGEVPDLYDGMNLTENAAKLTNIRCNRLFLMYALLSSNAQEHFSMKFHQVAQPKLSIETASNTLIALPPYAEQGRIVEELKHIFLLIDGIDNSKNDLDRSLSHYKSKILELAISGKLVPQDPSDEPAVELLRRINPDFKPCDNSHYEDLPIGWSICTLYDICDTINGLWKGKNPPFVNVGVIRNANFTKDFNLDYSKIEYIDVEQRAFEKRNLEDGDLIVEKSGGSDNFPVGRSILYQGESGKYSFSNFTMALRIKDKNLIRSGYLYFVILHKYLSGEMRQMQTQTTGLHNLLSDKYMSMPIPIPPTKEQDRIIDSIEKLLNKMNKIKTVL